MTKQGVRCVGCSIEKRDNPDIKFYKFPAEQERRDLWLKILFNASELINVNLSPEHQVCEKHFDERMIFVNSKRLAKSAVPLPIPPEMKLKNQKQSTSENNSNTNKDIEVIPDAEMVVIEILDDDESEAPSSANNNKDIVDFDEHERLNKEYVNLQRQIEYLYSNEFFIQKCKDILPRQIAQMAENHIKHPGSVLPIYMAPAAAGVNVLGRGIRKQ